MGILWVEIVVLTVKICGHTRDGIPLMLNPVSLTHLNPCNLGNGIPFVSRFKRTSEKSGFGYRLRSEFGVDARGTEEEEFLHTMFVSRVDHIGLDLEIDTNKISWVCVVGMNATNFSCSKDDINWLLCSKEGLNIGLASEIKLGMGSKDEICETLILEIADYGGSNQSPVSSDKDLCGFL